MIDVLIIVAVLALGVGGYFSGIVRRVVGLVAIAAGLFLATHLTYTAAAVWVQAFPTSSFPDALTLCYFAIALVVWIVFEVFGFLLHRHLQVSFVALDHVTGALLGALTALVAVTITAHLLIRSTSPTGFSSPDAFQFRINQALLESRLASGLDSLAGSSVATLLSPFVPGEPAQYFNNANH